MRKFIVCLCLSVHSFCSAQFSDSITHYLQLTASGNINTTNTDKTYFLNNEARFSIKSKKRTMNAFAGWVYGESNNRLTNNDFVTTFDFNLYNERGNFYYWGLANYTTNYSLKINNQLQTGLGVAYNFINNKAAWLNLSDGILFETSSVAVSDSVKNNYQTFRNSLRLGFRFVIKNVLTINGSNFLQNALTKNNDYIVRTNNSASIKLNKWLSFVTSFAYNRFNRTGSQNLLFTYGLSIEQYF